MLNMYWKKIKTLYIAHPTISNLFRVGIIFISDGGKYDVPVVFEHPFKVFTINITIQKRRKQQIAS